MKAYVLHKINDLRFEEVEIPEINDDEVLVKVKAVGICGSDIPRIYKTGTYHYPLIAGHEFSGEIVDCGKNIGRDILNKRVGVFPLIPCKRCMPCQNKKYELCRSYDYIGSRRNGAFAEYVAVPYNNIIEIPPEISYEEAAMLEPMGVAVHAIRRFDIKETDSVTICGLGTIGMFILMFLCEKSLKNVYVVGNKDIQKEYALKLGISADNFCDSRTTDAQNFIKERTNGNGTDIFFECIGKNEIYSFAVNNTAVGGKICLVGNPYSDMLLDRQIYWKILRNQLTITGTWNSSFNHDINDDWHCVLEKLRNGLINPKIFITHKLPFNELENGFHIMKDKSEEYIKIMGILS